MSTPDGAQTSRALRMVATLDQVRPTVRAVGSLARAAGLDPTRGARLELALAEILGNVVRHAYAGRDDGAIDVFFESSAFDVHVLVRDAGRPIDDPSARRPRVDPRRPEGLPENGRGLWIAYGAVSDASYAREGGANVWRLRQDFAA